MSVQGRDQSSIHSEFRVWSASNAGLLEGSSALVRVLFAGFFFSSTPTVSKSRVAKRPRSLASMSSNTRIPARVILDCKLSSREFIG